MGRGVDRRHLQRHQRIAAAIDGMADDAVHVAVIHQRAGMAIVRAEDEVPWVQTLLRHRRDLAFDIVPGRAQPHHRAHAVAHPGNRVRFSGALVIVRRPARHIGAEGDTFVGRSVMPADGLARPHRRRRAIQRPGSEYVLRRRGRGICGLSDAETEGCRGLRRQTMKAGKDR